MSFTCCAEAHDKPEGAVRHSRLVGMRYDGWIEQSGRLKRIFMRAVRSEEQLHGRRRLTSRWQIGFDLGVPPLKHALNIVVPVLEFLNHSRVDALHLILFQAYDATKDCFDPFVRSRHEWTYQHARFIGCNDEILSPHTHHCSSHGS